MNSHKSYEEHGGHHDLLLQRELQTGHETIRDQDDPEIQGDADGRCDPNECTEVDTLTFVCAIPLQPEIAHRRTLEDDGEERRNAE